MKEESRWKAFTDEELGLLEAALREMSFEMGVGGNDDFWPLHLDAKTELDSRQEEAEKN